jgi:hypothetical protein
MSIEAMKQALAALEGLWDDGFGGVPESMHKDAITALHQAIEQAEKQEPVAWMMINPSHLPGNRSLHWEPQQWHITWKAVPLYTTPVHASDISQKRVDETAKDRHEWVGLTDEQSEVLNDARNEAMLWSLKGRIPECGVFAGIAQNLDWLCDQENRQVAPTWVGLTQAEFKKTVNGLEDLIDCWQAIEAKLKEKNCPSAD